MLWPVRASVLVSICNLDLNDANEEDIAAIEMVEKYYQYLCLCEDARMIDLV